MTKTGNQKLIEQLMADGCYYMFGNPGTVEQGFLDAMGEYGDFHYITCLQESIAVAMADGYARKTGHAAVVQLHSGVGLGNGIGMIYQAMRGHSPLVILAGEAGIKYDAMDAQMACDLVAMAKPVTKWAGRVLHKDSVLRMVRRAVKLAMTPPAGPVFLSLPLDVLDEINTEPVYPSCRINTRTIPAATGDVEKAAELLMNAKHPLFIVGDGVSFSNGSDILYEAAELLGAGVYGADNSLVNFDRSSCMYLGDLGHMFGSDSKEKIKDADVVLIVGTYVFPEVFPCTDSPFKENAKCIQIDLNTYEIAKNFGVDIGIGADPAATMECLVSVIKDKQTESQKNDAKARINEMRSDKGKAEKSREEDGIFDGFCKYLREKTDEDVILFDEVLTVSPILNRYFQQKIPGTFFQTRGGSLGVGIPGAMGIKLAEPDKTVIGFTGDGGSLYTIQALQTAARYNIGAKFVIINNGDYRLLKNNLDRYRMDEHIPPHDYPDCFDLKPCVDFVKLAESMHIRARCLERVDEIGSLVDWFVSEEGPVLLEIKC